jgi:hypothetical protein
MRISKQQLQDIINEEVASVLDTSRNRKRISEALAPRSGGIENLPASELIRFAKAYTKLGGAVQEQLDDLLADPASADINPNAIEVIEDFLVRLNMEIAIAVEDWKEANGY